MDPFESVSAGHNSPDHFGNQLRVIFAVSAKMGERIGSRDEIRCTMMVLMGRFLDSNVSRPAWELTGAPVRHVQTAMPGNGVHPTVALRAPDNSTRRIALFFGLGVVLVRVSVMPEVLFYVLHFSTYLIYITGIPAIFAALGAGAVQRTLKSRTAWWWLGFFGFMLASLPFSSWVGGSANVIKDYAIYNLPLLFIAGGLCANWKDIRAVFYVLGVSGLINVLSARLFMKEQSGRIGFEASGTIGNENDLASHLLLVLPFILFIAMDRRRNPFLRSILLLPMGYAVYVILGTGSRGALVAMFAVFLFVIFCSAAKQRVAAIVLAGLLAATIPLLLGSSALARLGALFGPGDQETQESSAARGYLLKQSLIYTLQHPVFGVGVAQFSNFEGLSARGEGRTGNWHETHNAFTEVSSECGVPAAIFFVLGIFGSFAAVFRTYRVAKRGIYPEIANACFCYLVAMVGYLVSITFLANAYRFYLPLMVGLAGALSSVAMAEMSSQPVVAPAAQPPNRAATLRGARQR